MPFSFQRPKFSKLTQWLRWVYNFDGIDDRGKLQFRAINIEGDNTFEFWTPTNFTLNATIISQSISTAGNLREFQFGVDIGGVMYVGFGGIYTTVFTAAQGLKPATKYGVTLIGTQFSIFEGGLGGVLVKQSPFAKGAAREPSAVTLIGCRGNGAGSYFQFFNGLQYDLKINGTLWPMADRNQPIQLPSPSGLGEELITQSVYQTPFAKSAKWLKVDDTWTINDSAVQASESLTFLASAEMPPTGMIEFEIVSISGNLSCTNNLATGSVFSTVGKKRFFYTNYSQISSIAWRFRVTTDGPFSCVIKNISFKPLWTLDTTQLITNGDFTNDTSGWVVMSGGSLSVSSGVATLTTASGQPSRFEQGVILEPLAWYEYSADLNSFSGVVAVRLQMLRGSAGAFRQILGINYTSSGKMSFVFQAPASDAIAQITGDSTNAGTVVVDNVSLRKLTSICNPLTLVNTTSDRWQEVS